MLVRGVNMMMGYWNLPELSTETLKGGWMHTGDAARMDENGSLFLGDRIKGMIKSGGENVFSLEVKKVRKIESGISCEANVTLSYVILSHSNIAMGIVIGVPDHWERKL